MLGDEPAANAAPALPPVQHQVAAAARGMRLVDYLKARLVVVPSREIGTLITSGFVRIHRVDAESVGRTFDSLAAGDRISIEAAALAELKKNNRWTTPWDTQLRIHHEDEDLLVVEKTAGVHVHPLGVRRSATLLGALVFHAGARTDQPWGEWRPHIVQRLDRAASGLVLVAKGAAMKSALVRALQHGDVQRRYRAMVTGSVREDAGTIDQPLGRDPSCDYRRGPLSIECGGQRAVTCWRVVERRSEHTVLDVDLLTGRTHQIRAHLAGIGHPIVGDRLYSCVPWGTGATRPQPAPIAAAPQTSAVIALHAAELEFRHPRSDARLHFRSPPPAGFGL